MIKCKSKNAYRICDILIIAIYCVALSCSKPHWGALQALQVLLHLHLVAGIEGSCGMSAIVLAFMHPSIMKSCSTCINNVDASQLRQVSVDESMSCWRDKCSERAALNGPSWILKSSNPSNTSSASLCWPSLFTVSCSAITKATFSWNCLRQDFK